MGTIIVSVYIKLNIILLVAFLVWSGFRKLTQFLNCSLSNNIELSLARIYFLFALALPVLFSTINFSSLLSWQLMEMLVIGQNVSAGVDNGLTASFTLADQRFDLIALVITLLVVGAGSLFINASRRYRQLKHILGNSTQWKSLNGVSILFSQEVTTPFSTRVLGKSQIILPYQLLESPRNLRLAVKHELQHIRNGDLNWVLLLDYIKPFFFWNPAFYAWHNEFHCLQEYACDEALVNKPDVGATAYGNCLLEVASHSCDKALFASSNMVPNFALFRSAQSQLKRRIIMMKKTRNKKFESVRLIIYPLSLILVLAGCSMNVMGPAKEMRPINMREISNPRYPNMALAQGINGWAVVQFTVDTEGNVKDPIVVSSCNSLDSSPTRNEYERGVENCADDVIFDSPTLTYVEQFKYEPPLVEIPRVKFKLNYQVDN